MSASLLSHCRLCAEQKSAHELLDLTTNFKFRREIVDKLTIFSSRVIDFSIKTLPETVCTQCIQTLNCTYDFYTKIKTSQLDLLRLSTLKTDLDNNFSCESSYLEFSLPKIEGNCETSDSEYSCREPLKIEENVTEFKIQLDDIMLPDQKFGESSLVTWSTYLWCCSHCDDQLASVSALRKHSKECHNICFSMECFDCKHDYFDDFDTFVEHVRGHRRGLQQYCQHCNMKLDPETASDHITAHTCQPHCYVCGEFFTDDFTLHAHLSQYQKHAVCNMSWQEYEWVCKECNTKLTDQDSLRLHVKEVHQICFGMQCADCTETVESFHAFVDHVREHKPSLKYYCQYCNHEFENAQDNIIHLSKHLKNQCQKCGECLPTPESLRSHTKTYKSKRKQKTLMEKNLTSNVKVTKNLTDLRQRKYQNAVKKRVYTCDRCGKTYGSNSALTTHKIIHENKEPEVCKICMKTFLTLTRLKKHVKTHNEERNFLCDHCQKGFKSKEQLKGHLVCHSNVMRYSCQFCSKTFRFSNLMKVHLSQHTGARPYSCPSCPMEFTNWSNCNKHMLRRHGATLAKTVLTPQGKVPINPKTGKPKKVQDLAMIKEWTEQILTPRKKGPKTT